MTAADVRSPRLPGVSRRCTIAAAVLVGCGEQKSLPRTSELATGSKQGCPCTASCMSGLRARRSAGLLPGRKAARAGFTTAASQPRLRCRQPSASVAAGGAAGSSAAAAASRRGAMWPPRGGCSRNAAADAPEDSPSRQRAAGASSAMEGTGHGCSGRRAHRCTTTRTRSHRTSPWIRPQCSQHAVGALFEGNGHCASAKLICYRILVCWRCPTLAGWG